MKAIFLETNITLGDHGTDNEDYFAGVYSDKIAVVSMVIMYFIGLFGIMGIVFIIWIERSGQAGPYRTLINQLVSHNYQALIPYYCIGNTLDTIRAVYGALPRELCWVGVISKNWSHYAVLLFTLAIILTKFTFICIFKSMPVMDDNFVVLFISTTINATIVVIIYLCVVLPGKEPLAMLICTGKFDEEWLSEPKKIPTVAYSLLVCFLLGMIATIITHIFKRIGKKKQFRQNQTIRENTVDLGSLTISACLMTLIVMSFYSLVKYESLHPSQLEVFPNYLWLFSFQIFYPATIMWTMVIGQSRNEKFIRVLKRTLNYDMSFDTLEKSPQHRHSIAEEPSCPRIIITDSFANSYEIR